MRLRTGTALLIFQAGCASSAVPVMTPDELTKPRLQYLEPRDVALKVTDERAVPDQDKSATESQVTEALRDVLAAAGIGVRPGSSNTLNVSLHYPERPALGMDQESCVEIVAELLQASNVRVIGRTLGCAERKFVFGLVSGPDTTGAFQQATDGVLKELDRGQSAVLKKLMEPPRFEADRIEIPGFANVRVRSVAVTVADDWSNDGAVGRNLREQLEKALRASGMKVVDKAEQRLTLTLTKPKESAGFGNREGCLEIRAEARFENGSTSGQSTACRGADETLHHRALNDLLRILDQELTRALARRPPKP
jgi:hypothetical protein